MTNCKFIAHAYSNNEDYSADCDFALFVIDSQLYTQLRDLRNGFARREARFPSLRAMIHGAPLSAFFISRRAATNLLGVTAFEQMDSACSDDPLLVQGTGSVDLDKFDATPSDDLVVEGRGVYWRAYPKHTSITVETPLLTWSWFSRCRHCGAERDDHIKLPLTRKLQCPLQSTTYESFQRNTGKKAPKTSPP